MTHRKCLARIFTVSLLLAASVVHAASIPTDLTITARIDYDAGFAANHSGAALNGILSAVMDGSETATGFTNGMLSGSGSLTGSLTQTGDGVFIRDVTAFATNSASGKAGIDSRLTLSNRSATVTYDVVLLFDRANHATAFGTNAYVQSEFTLDEEGKEAYFTDIESDVIYGDQLNGTSLSTVGALTSDSGLDVLDLQLGPNASMVFDSDWTFKIESFGAGSGADGQFSGAVTVFFAGNKTADTDSDGYTDYEEAVAGSSQSDSDDFFRVSIDREGADTLLNWPALPNRVYSVFARTNLISGAWTPVVIDVPATPPMNLYVTDSPARFFYLDVELDAP